MLTHITKIRGERLPKNFSNECNIVLCVEFRQVLPQNQPDSVCRCWNIMMEDDREGRRRRHRLSKKMMGEHFLFFLLKQEKNLTMTKSREDRQEWTINQMIITSCEDVTFSQDTTFFLPFKKTEVKIFIYTDMKDMRDADRNNRRIPSSFWKKFPIMSWLEYHIYMSRTSKYLQKWLTCCSLKQKAVLLRFETRLNKLIVSRTWQRKLCGGCFTSGNSLDFLEQGNY